MIPTPLQPAPAVIVLALCLAALATSLGVSSASPGEAEDRGWGWGMASDPDTSGVAARIDSLRAIRLTAAAPLPATRGAAPHDSVRAAGGVDYLWVLRGALVSRASVDSVIRRARSMGVRGLLVQVVGRGDAFYRSRLLPRAEALGHAPAGFDPLEAVVERAHASNLEVHAWVNALLVWSAPHPPRDPAHVLRRHPEWVATLADGRAMSELGERERRALALEGVFLSPGHPRVRAWLGAIAAEIARRYPVDGIHLDYIRQPGVPIGFDPTTRARFALESGVDPQRFDALERGRRAAVDAAWARFQQAQVTAVVRAVRDSLEAARPGLALSAAVIADTITAERANAQRWRAWVRERLVDRVYPMCYAPSIQRVMDQLAAFGRELGATDRVVPGIAVFNTSPSAAAFKILGARTLGFPLIALYSYDSLFARDSLWDDLRERIAATKSPDGRNP